MMKKLAESGKTILFSTHKMDEADFCDREIKMEQGRIVYDSNDAFQNQPDQPEKKSTENELLCEQKVCSSVKLLSNLRAVSAAISGSNRKKSLIEKIPSFFRIIIFLVMFVLTLSSRSIPVCTLMFVLSVIYARISNLKIKKLISSYLKIFPFLPTKLRKKIYAAAFLQNMVLNGVAAGPAVKTTSTLNCPTGA